MNQLANEGLARGMKQKLQSEEKAIGATFDSGLQRGVEAHSLMQSYESVRKED
jgi:hypothetical protein